jgi:hypothetical protein
MPQDTGVPPLGSGSRPTDRASKAVSPVPASIPNAVAELRSNADALNAYLKSFDEHVRNASDPLFGRGYGLEEKIADLFQLTGRLASSIYQGLLATASAIEAGTVETEGLDAKHESAVPQGDAHD